MLITQEPFHPLPSNFDKRTRENHGNNLSLILKFQAEWVDFRENPGKAGFTC